MQCDCWHSASCPNNWNLKQEQEVPRKLHSNV